MTLQQLFNKLGWVSDWQLFASKDHLPCFAHRVSVHSKVNTPDMIEHLIKFSSEKSDNDVLVFSVTEKDKCWDAWIKYAKAHPRKFKIVNGGSIHGVYMCRMYIYTKSPKQRKFHQDNIKQFKAR